jgi:hypothetical protein
VRLSRRQKQKLATAARRRRRLSYALQVRGTMKADCANLQQPQGIGDKGVANEPIVKMKWSSQSKATG